MEEISVVGVAFEPNGRKYFFDSNNLDLTKGTKVIVETERGLQFGFVEELKIIDKKSIKDNLKKGIAFSLWFSLIYASALNCLISHCVRSSTLWKIQEYSKSWEQGRGVEGMIMIINIYLAFTMCQSLF